MSVFLRVKILALLFALLAGVAVAAEPPKLLATLRPEHPRLLATAGDFATLQKQVAANAEAARWLAALRAQAETVLAAPPSRHALADGKRLLPVSRTVRDRTFLLALLFRLTGEHRYADRLWRELDAVAQFKDWNPAHFLDTAEMTAGVAIGLDWLHAEWTPEQRATLTRAIIEKGLRPALELYRGQKWWVVARHNWNLVCNGGIGLGALAIAREEPELAAEILAGAVASFPRALASYAPDGAWPEGPLYWSYATDYAVLFLAGMRTALGHDAGLADAPGFGTTGDFPIVTTGPTGQPFNFADASGKVRSAMSLLWLAERFQQPTWAAWQLRTLAGAAPDSTHDQYAQAVTGAVHPLDLLWGARWLERAPRLDALPLAEYFRGPEVVTFRSGWDDPRASFLAAKGGDNRVNHSQLDLGSFVFDALGQRWAFDLGRDDYNLPGYFDVRGKRWDFYRCRAEGNNCLVIASGAAPDQDPQAAAHVTEFAEKEQRAVIDLTAAHGGRAQRATREFALVGGRDALIRDDVTLKSPADVWWFMHTLAEVTLERDGAGATLQLGGETLRAEIVEPANARFEIMPAEPLPSSPHPPRQQGRGQMTGPLKARDADIVVPNARKLAIHLRGQTAFRLTVKLTPQ